jgi:hypothetical protein
MGNHFMKKHLLVVFLVMSSGFLLAEESWNIRLGSYICSFFAKTENLPQIAAIREYGNDNIQEFNASYSQPTSLWTRCNKLNFLDLNNRWPFSTQLKEKEHLKDKDQNLLPISAQDHALLTFARIMVAHEKEWKEWHTCEKRSDEAPTNIQKSTSKKTTTGIRHFFETTIGLKKVRNDINSPYYEHFSNVEGNSEEEMATMNALNALENEAYHDELQFLQTQLHKMELYWNMKSDEEKKSVTMKNDYQKTHSVLANEIALFKKSDYRGAFLKSCARKQDSQSLQFMRDTYKASNLENNF